MLNPPPLAKEVLAIFPAIKDVLEDKVVLPTTVTKGQVAGKPGMNSAHEPPTAPATPSSPDDNITVTPCNPSFMNLVCKISVRLVQWPTKLWEKSLLVAHSRDITDWEEILV